MLSSRWEKPLLSICQGAGTLLLKYFGKVRQIEIKPGAGIVTEADKAAESYVVKQTLRNILLSSDQILP